MTQLDFVRTKMLLCCDARFEIISDENFDVS